MTEEIIKFLIIMGVIAFAIYRQAAKARKAAQEADKQTPAYDPDIYKETDEEEDWMKTFYPEPTPGSTAVPASTPGKKVKDTSRRSTAQMRQKSSGNTIQQQLPEASDEKDYGIHSAEDARKAIIWSEILNRKYE